MEAKDIEINLKLDPYHGKIVVPAARRQQPHTCFISSSSTCVESKYKRKGALQDPQEDFEVRLSTEDFIAMYEKEYGPIGGEAELLSTHGGFARLTNALEILKKEGVPGIKDKPEKKFPQDIKKLLNLAHAMLGTFKISKNYKTLKPGDIYVYDRNNRELVNGRTCSHAVAIIGYGCRGGVWYYVFQNSYGESWGEDGIGRYFFSSLNLS
ncbi:hypothetical protein BRADI_3g32251v3 [Brachypodium distachyon]|uniref:Peptidase C1A papain C-terminal domain-containing protein n=1 Tax=Brachypodium distachyon TaxID=15368 RepID=A0A0Q3JHF8_BRADI|nr:hypothetical protein BRADI_3g32251v3 [Brachypodium distachyon]